MTDSNLDSETKLLGKLKTGDKDAANELMGRYFERVVRAASQRIAGRRLRGVDSEDIAASVFESLWKKADQNQFKETALTCDEFWRLICTMVKYKTEDHLRRERADKRGGGMVRGESMFGNASDQSVAGISGLSDGTLSPSEIISFREMQAQLFDALKDPILHEIVTMRMEDRTVAEIATHFDKSESWVKRKLALIREIWQAKLDESEA